MPGQGQCRGPGTWPSFAAFPDRAHRAGWEPASLWRRRLLGQTTSTPLGLVSWVFRLWLWRFFQNLVSSVKCSHLLAHESVLPTATGVSPLATRPAAVSSAAPHGRGPGGAVSPSGCSPGWGPRPCPPAAARPPAPSDPPGVAPFVLGHLPSSSCTSAIFSWPHSCIFGSLFKCSTAPLGAGG